MVKTGRLALMAVILTFVGAATYISYIIFERQAALGEVSRYNVQWSASQAVIELTRLQQAVAMAAMPGADEDEPRLRYDIFVNRLSLLSAGEVYRFLQHDETLLDTLADAKKAIAELSGVIDAVAKPENAEQALERLGPLTRKFISLAAAANRFGGEEVARSQGELFNLYWLFSIMVAGLILCGFALIGLLFWHNGLLRQTHAYLRKATEQLRETSVSRACLDAALNNMSQGLCMFDAKHDLIVSNPQFSTVVGLAPGVACAGTSLPSLIEQAASSNSARALRLLSTHRERIAGSSAPSDFEVLSDDKFIAVTHRPMQDGGWVATFEDVTERKRTEARIAYLATHDALTGLPNRVRFREEIEKAVHQIGPRGEGIAVLSLDLDDFKRVNDTLGHSVGDALLCAVGERLRQAIRVKDTPARLGGDEFAIIQIAADQPAAADALGERLVKLLAAPYAVEGHEVTIAASVGIAFATDKDADPDTLLRSADLALYNAKSSGRGTYKLFEPYMNARAQKRRQLEQDLHQALLEGQFELAYQPFVNLRTGRFVGCEALLRWHHPVRGMVSPGEFIQVAEEIGLTDPIGEWVLKVACTEAAAWPQETKIAVNVSPVQFRTKRLVQAVTQALAVSGLPAERLELEITESVLLLDTGETIAILHQLRQLGVAIAMDDFGTGYSSLSYLKSFPFDKIKIDQSFVRDMLDRSDSLAIVRAITGLGRTLGMVTIAEGVETREQLEQVRIEGCIEAQGYLLSRPISPEKVAALLATNAANIDVAA